MESETLSSSSTGSTDNARSNFLIEEFLRTYAFDTGLLGSTGISQKLKSQPEMANDHTDISMNPLTAAG